MSFPSVEHIREVLTKREYQVMALISRGSTNKICADELQISQRTIEAHRARVLKKLKVRNAAELAFKLNAVRRQF